MQIAVVILCIFNRAIAFLGLQVIEKPPNPLSLGELIKNAHSVNRVTLLQISVYAD